MACPIQQSKFYSDGGLRSVFVVGRDEDEESQIVVYEHVTEDCAYDQQEDSENEILEVNEHGPDDWDPGGTQVGPRWWEKIQQKKRSKIFSKIVENRLEKLLIPIKYRNCNFFSVS